MQFLNTFQVELNLLLCLAIGVIVSFSFLGMILILNVPSVEPLRQGICQAVAEKTLFP